MNKNFLILAFQTQRHKDSKSCWLWQDLFLKDTRDFLLGVSDVLEKGK
jgi:hypothetical protein